MDVEGHSNGSGAAAAEVEGGPPEDDAAADLQLQRTTDRPLTDYGMEDVEALYGAWWPLFPLRRGLLPGKAVTTEQLRHLFLYFDNRFAHDMPLLFHLANTVLRHAVNSADFASARVLALAVGHGAIRLRIFRQAG